MLYWIFTSYREGIAPYLLAPLLLAGLLMPLVAAFSLGKAGQKVSHLGLGHRERRLMAAALALPALAATHLLLLVAGGLALDRTLPASDTFILNLLVGPPAYDRLRLLAGAAALLASGAITAGLVYQQLRDGGKLREFVQRLRDPQRQRGELGSAHFCYPGDFVRLQKPKGEYELRLLGSFYGKQGRGDKPGSFYRLDKGPNRNNQWPWIALSAEDQARGLCLVGPARHRQIPGGYPAHRRRFDAGRPVFDRARSAGRTGPPPARLCPRHRPPGGYPRSDR